MNPFDASAAEGFPPAVIGSPRRSDFAVLRSAVAEAGLPVKALAPGVDLAADLQSIGCLILAQEALTGDLLRQIEEALGRQPVWSELPIVVVAEASMKPAGREIVKRQWQPAQTIFQDRPLRVNEFRGAVQFALAARLRQFQIRDRIAQEEELRRELNHRVKNILATVQSIASMTRRMSPSPDQAFDQFTARLEALGSVHTTLHETADHGASFEDIVLEISRPYRGSSGLISTTGTARALKPQSATLLGLCIYELLTNAVKYGALSVPSGRVETALMETEAGAELTWKERDGPPVTPPGRSGYGSRFISATLGSLFGKPPHVTHGAAGFALSVEGPSSELFAAS